MARAVGSVLHDSGAHRIILAFILAVAYSRYLAGWAGFGTDVTLDGVLLLGAVALLVAGLGAIRVGVVSVGAGATVGLVVVLVLSGAWLAAAAAIVAVGVETVYFVASPAVSRRWPVDVLLAGVEGLLVPVIGFTIVSGGLMVPWGLFAVTAPLALSLAIAASLWEDSKGQRDRVSLSQLVTPAGASVFALLAGSGAIAVVLGGAGIELHPELALLASAVSVMCAFFGWLALVDRRAEWRNRRVAGLVTANATALSLGLAVVLLFA